MKRNALLDEAQGNKKRWMEKEVRKGKAVQSRNIQDTRKKHKLSKGHCLQHTEREPK